MNSKPNKPSEEINGKYIKGSVEEFDSMWSNLSKNSRYHFKRGAPENQIQYAFQNHWRVFNKIIQNVVGGKVLEVGCGRGSLAAFFVDNNYETHLLGTALPALQLAKANFAQDDLNGIPTVGDALKLPYKSGSFDVVSSIGLFEHFAEIELPLREQIRILKKGGYFLGYVVPEKLFSVQLLGRPINFLLELEDLFKNRNIVKASSASFKEELFRNIFGAKDYILMLETMGVEKTGSCGLFPVPMISHSYKFPFTLMSPEREKTLVKLWDFALNLRFWRNDPWECPENWGLAFLVWAKK